MEDLSAIYRKAEDYGKQLEEQRNEYILKLRAILCGKAANAAATTVLTEQANASSPQQVKKRPKRLTSLREDEDEENKPPLDVEAHSPRKSTRASNSKLLATAESLKEDEKASKVNDRPEENIIIVSAETLMPPPPVPAPSEEQSFARPQRAAKLKSEKNLKEPKLNAKLRRPSNSDTVEVKLEQEHRQSQLIEISALSHSNSKSSLASTRSEESVVVVPGKNPSLVVINSDEEQTEDKMKDTQQKKDSLEKPDSRNMRSCRVNIKREKTSFCPEEQKQFTDQATIPAITLEPPPTVPMPKIPIKTENPSDDSTLTSTILSATSTSTAPAATKKGRKKNNKHKPIKVERFSDIVASSPIASRTRKGSVGRSSSEHRAQQQEQPRAGSVYEDAVDNLPVSSQTREAIETPPTRISKVQIATAAAAVNETVTLSMDNQNPNATTTTGSDATFCTNPAQTTFQVAGGQTTFVVDNQNPNATVTLTKKSNSDVDATFNVSQKNGQRSLSSTKHSMETAKDTSQPHDDSLITEDDSFERPVAAVANNMPAPKVPIISKLPTSAKASYKIPTRTNELFNPLVQSPVKMKVRAFENAATSELTKSGRPKRTKETAMRTPSQPIMVLPAVGKLTAPALGRFLTPTQASNITPNAMAQVKKGPNSASKALPFPKSTTTLSASSQSSSSSNLKTTNSTSSKTLMRENSADDFRKGLHQMAEERKKQREQKHLLAAQQREAKERERTERVAKLAKEREEKRLKKQHEAEQKKRELDEIQRKLRLQEEAAHAAEIAKQKAAKTKAIVDQERELLLLMKQQQQKAGSSSKKRIMPPPPSKVKYNFEMLHEDDPTDDESTPSDTRPPPPSWSRSHVCAPIKLAQSFAPTDIIDCFFSVQPMTPDLKEIFPDIDARYLKRNSSVLWSTPPRYSELPKY